MNSVDTIVRRVTLRELRLLLAVARSGSILKAADDVGLTQPAVSKAIADLEGTLGVRLFAARWYAQDDEHQDYHSSRDREGELQFGNDCRTRGVVGCVGGGLRRLFRRNLCRKRRELLERLLSRDLSTRQAQGERAWSSVRSLADRPP